MPVGAIARTSGPPRAPQPGLARQIRLQRRKQAGLSTCQIVLQDVQNISARSWPANLACVRSCSISLLLDSVSTLAQYLEPNSETDVLEAGKIKVKKEIL